MKKISLGICLLTLVLLAFSGCSKQEPKTYYSYEVILSNGYVVNYDANGTPGDTYKDEKGNEIALGEWEAAAAKGKFISFTLGSGSAVTSFVNGGSEMISDNMKITYKTNKDGLTMKLPYGEVVFEADGENYKMSADGETVKFKELKEVK